MITYKKAYKIAAELMRNIDTCVEYENAYMFKRKAEMHSIGGNGACVVLKESGKAIGQTEYYDNYEAVLVKEFDVSMK